MQLNLNKLYNLRLYYLGMFYNMFLPGSVGGDGFKVYILKQNSAASLKQLVSATLLDRLSGLSVLVAFSGLLLLLSSLNTGKAESTGLFILIALIPLPAFYIGVHLFFNQFESAYLPTSSYSLFVQAGQLVCAFTLLQALNINSNYADYLALFMLSSVVAVVPFTIGGVGARELVFLYAYQYMDIQEAQSIAFTILFFCTTAVTALSGLFFAYGIEDVSVTDLSGKTLDEDSNVR